RRACRGAARASQRRPARSRARRGRGAPPWRLGRCPGDDRHEVTHPRRRRRARGGRWRRPRAARPAARAAARRRGLPDLGRALRTFISFDETGRAEVSYVRRGRVVPEVRVERVEAEPALAYARHMAPVFDAGAVIEDSSDLPRSISLVSLLGPEMFDAPDAVV